MKKYDSVIFDLDGTLWDSGPGIVESWGRVLQAQPDVDFIPTQKDFERVAGLGAADLTAVLLPNLPLARRLEIFDACAVEECKYLTAHGGILYPELLTMLERLSQKVPLFIVSNCADGYIESFLTAHDTWKYIQDFECIGRTGKGKAENIRLIVQRNGLENPVYVGDTQWDCDAATAAGVPFIFAAYGFGKVADHPQIHCPMDLLDCDGIR